MMAYQYLPRDEFVEVAAGCVPSIVLSYAYGNWISRVIVRVSNRWQRDRHEYSHAMALCDKGVLATQGLFFKKQPLGRFLNSRTRLKIWECTGPSFDKQVVLGWINEDLEDPWVARLYDAPGIAGQWLGNTLRVGRFVNLPILHYCSSRVVKHFRPWMPGIIRQASPAQIDRYCAYSKNWKCRGVYDPCRESENA